MKLIKIYGERNTNTNYISKLIDLNLDVEEIPGTVPPGVMWLQKILPGNEIIRDLYFSLTAKKNLGWKHSLVIPELFVDKKNCAFVTITKNPYSWLLSLYKRPYHQYYSDNNSFEDFLKCSWRTVYRENTKRILFSPIELWNIKNRSYLFLDSEKTMNITTESLFSDPARVIENISDKFSIRKKSDIFVNYDRSTKEENKDSSYYRDFYLTEKWRDDLSSEAIHIINQSVDKKLMSHFGYRLLD